MSETKFKNLTVDNVFDFAAVLDVIGLDSVIGAFDRKEITALQKSGKDVTGIGIVMAMKISSILIKNLSKARTEIYTFFANCMEWENGKAVTPDELSKFAPGTFLRLVKEFSKKDDLADFFKEVAGFMGTEQTDLKN